MLIFIYQNYTALLFRSQPVFCNYFNLFLPLKTVLPAYTYQTKKTESQSPCLCIRTIFLNLNGTSHFPLITRISGRSALKYPCCLFPNLLSKSALIAFKFFRLCDRIIRYASSAFATSKSCTSSTVAIRFTPRKYSSPVQYFERVSCNSESSRIFKYQSRPFSCPRMAVRA